VIHEDSVYAHEHKEHMDAARRDQHQARPARQGPAKLEAEEAREERLRDGGALGKHLPRGRIDDGNVAHRSLSPSKLTINVSLCA
jgi:hypothetical protein